MEQKALFGFGLKEERDGDVGTVEVGGGKIEDDERFARGLTRLVETQGDWSDYCKRVGVRG